MRQFTFLALLLTLTIPQTSCCAESITAEMQRADPRLEKKVTIVRQSIRIGDLIDRLSKDVGIEITANERQGASDDQLLVYFKDVPLVDALNAIWSLMSYKVATWHWERTGEPGSYKYELQRLLPARNLAARLQQMAQNSYLDEAERVRKYLTMSPEELRKAAKTDRQAKLLSNDDRHRRGLSAFFTCLSPEEQRSILSGETTFSKVPLSRMSENDRAGILAEAESEGGFSKDLNGNLTPTPPPKYIFFSSGRDPGKVVPSLHIAAEGHGGVFYLGGRSLEEEFAKKLEGAWLLPGDELSDPLELTKVPSPKEESDKRSDQNIGTVLKLRLGQLAKGAPLAVVARLPELHGNSTWDPGTPWGRSVQDFIEEMRNPFFTLQTKWRSHILIATYAGWFQEEAKKPPISVVRRLRKSALEHDGFVPLSDLVFAAGKMTDDQLETLGKDMPAMGIVRYWHGLMSLCFRSPSALTAMRSTHGLPITQDILDILSKMIHNPFKPHIETGEAQSIRLVEGTAGASPLIDFGFINQDGKLQLLEGFTQAPIPKEKLMEDMELNAGR